MSTVTSFHRPRGPARAVLAAMLAAATAAACGPPGEPTPQSAFEPPPAVAAARAGSVTSAQIARQNGKHRAEELLQGRFAGVEVQQLASGGVSVRIRGVTSLALSTEPLYVVNGMPIAAEPGGALRWLNPQDIERIEVLKDPAETAMYGSRGAAGVILISTKQ